MRKAVGALLRDSLRGFPVLTRAVPLRSEGVPERFLVSSPRLASPDEGVRKGFPESSECRSGAF